MEGCERAAKWLHYNPLLLLPCGLGVVHPPHVRLTLSPTIMSIRPEPGSALAYEYKPERVM